MANLAQVVNVLQAMILTEGDQMLLTPTYHVFEMYKVHQDNELLELTFESPDYTFGEITIPQLSVSASRDASGKVYVSICNLSHKEQASLSFSIEGVAHEKVSGLILTHTELNAHNTFEAADNVTPSVYDGASLKGGVLDCKLPPASVVVLTLE